MADSEYAPLSDWLELMLGEIARRQEEAQAAELEQAARAAQTESQTLQPQARSRLHSQPRTRSPVKRTTHA